MRVAGTRGWQVRIFAITWVAYAGYYLCRKNYGVLMPILSREAGFTKEVLAHAIFGFSLTYALGQFLMGALADRFGARRVVTAGMLVSGAASTATALWPAPEAMVALQTLNGLAQACGWPGLAKVLASWFPRRNRGVVMAWWTNNYVVGGFLATVFATYAATGPLLATAGWKRAAVAPGILLMLLGVAHQILVRDRPEDAGLPAIEPAGNDATPLRRAPMLEAARRPAIRLLAASYFFVKVTRYAFLFWLPMYLSERLRFSDSQAGYASSIYELAGFAGVLASGYLSDAVFQSRRFPVATLFLFLLAGACALPPALAGWSPWAATASIALIGVFVFGADTLIGGAATQDASTVETAASAAGFVNGIGSLGQLLSPYLVAWTVRSLGWDALFYFFLLFSVAGGVLLASWGRSTPLEPEVADT